MVEVNESILLALIFYTREMSAKDGIVSSDNEREKMSDG